MRKCRMSVLRVGLPAYLPPYPAHGLKLLAAHRGTPQHAAHVVASHFISSPTYITSPCHLRNKIDGYSTSTNASPTQAQRLRFPGSHGPLTHPPTGAR